MDAPNGDPLTGGPSPADDASSNPTGPEARGASEARGVPGAREVPEARGASPASASTRPDRRIAVLLAIALAATGFIVGFVWLTQPPGHGSSPVPDTIAKGQPAPTIRGTTLDGSTVDLSQLRGHPVVINFWGPSCVPCRDEMPLLAQKAATHAASGLVIVGVLTDDPVEPARQFAAEFGATWQTVIDPDGSIKRAYRVLARPQSYFVDKDGILRSIQIGYLTDADFERQFGLIAGA
jgi:cytochrome c biogenesis protein CcmG/thiol:disulfide interchange protein DsbE